MLKFLDRESVDLFHGDTFKASEVARMRPAPYRASRHAAVQDYIRRSAALAKRGVEGEGAPAAAAGEGAAEDDLNVKSES